MDAMMSHASDEAMEASKSLARRRHLLSHTMVRSTLRRRGKMTKCRASDRLTISMVSRSIWAMAVSSFGLDKPHRRRSGLARDLQPGIDRGDRVRHHDPGRRRLPLAQGYRCLKCHFALSRNRPLAADRAQEPASRQATRTEPPNRQRHTVAAAMRGAVA